MAISKSICGNLNSRLKKRGILISFRRVEGVLPKLEGPPVGRGNDMWGFMTVRWECCRRACPRGARRSGPVAGSVDRRKFGSLYLGWRSRPYELRVRRTCRQASASEWRLRVNAAGVSFDDVAVRPGAPQHQPHVKALRTTLARHFSVDDALQPSKTSRALRRVHRNNNRRRADKNNARRAPDWHRLHLHTG
jgi:hypothetical protein